MPTLYIADAERDADMKNLSRKEAAKVLEDMKVKIEIPKAAVTQWERNTALDMAIEALKYSEVPNSSDCISSQAAIDMAISALEKQIPKRAVGEHYAHMRCPSCNHRIPSGAGSSSRRRDNWCNYCGQAIDWRNE